MFITNLSITKDQRGIITIEGNKIKGQIDKNNILVNYSLKNKNYERTHGGNEYISFYNESLTELKLTEIEIIKDNNSSIYTSYSFKKIGNVQISNYDFTKYIEEYTTKFGFSYYKEYYIHKITEEINLIIEIDENIQDIKDINLAIQVKN